MWIPVYLYDLGFLPHVIKCTSDRSWFVKSAATDLISKILSSMKSSGLESFADDDNVILSHEEQKLMATVFAPLITDEALDSDGLSVCLEILEKLDLSLWVFSYLCLDKIQLVERLCVLLKYLPASLNCDTEIRLLDTLTFVCESRACLNEAKMKLVQLVTTLLNDGKVLSAVALAAWLLKRFVATS